MNASAVFPLSNVEPRSVELPLMAGTAVPRRVKEAAGRRYPRRDLPVRAYRSTASPSSAVDGVPDETTCESDLGLFSDLQCIVDFDAKVTYR